MSRETMKAVHRHDAEVFADVTLALDAHPDLSTTVHVHVNDGVVTLTGTVRTLGERLTVEQALRVVEGVRRVIDLVNVTEMPDIE